MVVSELYERLRLLLSKGENVIGLPKHEVTMKLLKNMFTQQEAEILTSSFSKVSVPMNVKKISRLSNIGIDDLTDILEEMYHKGKLIKLGTLYVLLPYLPGGFEVYFTTNRDDPERMKKVAEAHLDLFKLGFPYELSASDYTIYRVIPTIKPTEKLIEIENSMELEHQILPFEILEDYLAKANPKVYAVVPCSCRNAAKLAGEPCNQTDENFCVTTGTLAKMVIEQGVGREVSLDELMEVMEKAEKEGLVHETFNMQDTAMFVCNCCSCCCGFLKSVKELNNYNSITKSNFEPHVHQEDCTLCEKCLEICPMGAIYHHWPHKEDSSDNEIKIRLDRCIGCGLCASNCPEEAIILEKVREVVPVKSQIDLLTQRAAGKTH
ncbi:MAG: 4Fe-4S binding protein [Candidatus Lokiarchaeota archaeon]|nr:4Fe-4S binding protein [Candidatus Lokiarchaeota archaeon]